MRRNYRSWAVGLVLLGWGTTRLAAQAPNVPVFSLWAVEVTDGMGGPNKCSSCPTQIVPAGQMAPGDVVRVEAYVSSWDAEPNRGICDGDPQQGQGGICNNIGMSCPGKHCANNGTACATDVNCSGSTCVQNTCVAFPRAAAYTVTIEGDSLVSGSAGRLALHQISCNPADCAVLGQGLCPCAQFHTLPNDCSCTASVCSASTNTCDRLATAFIEKTQPDFLFFGKDTHFDLVGFTPIVALSDFDFNSALSIILVDGVVDNGTRRNVGTALLKANADADGTFTITFFKHRDATFLVNANAGIFDGNVYQDLIIHVEPCCVNLNCDDNNLCTADERDCTDFSCQTCLNTPVTCDPGMQCNPQSGACEEVPDDDGDGVTNDVDVCPGVDDGIFAPGCVAAIPTVSHWGMIVLSLMIAVLAKVQFGRRYGRTGATI